MWTQGGRWQEHNLLPMLVGAGPSVDAMVQDGWKSENVFDPAPVTLAETNFAALSVL